MRVCSLLVAGLMGLTLCLPAQAQRNRLKLQINKGDVDLEARTLYFRMNRPADSAEIRIYTPEGKLLVEKSQLYNGAPAGKRLSISWPSLLEHKDNFRLEFKATDTDEFWVAWEVIRFYLEIPHEEVVFETGKSDLRQSEGHKLEKALFLLKDALKKYGKLVQCKLYVGGFTDTVGSVGDNRVLSQNRARSIARYFRKNGLKKVPIFVRGFGEELPKVQTGDNVDEERNRRALYIISNAPPEMSGPGGWQSL